MSDEKSEERSKSIKDLRGEFLKINLEECEIQLLLGFSNRHKDAEKLKFDTREVHQDQVVASKLKEIVSKFIRMQSSMHPNQHFSHFTDPPLEPKYDVTFLLVSEESSPLERRAFKLHDGLTRSKHLPYKAGERGLNDPRFFCYKITPTNQEPIYFVRSVNARMFVKTGKIGFISFAKEGALTQIITEPIFCFDEEIDFVMRNGVIYAHRFPAIELLLGYRDEIIAKAGPACDKVHRKLPIKDFPEFRRKCIDDTRLGSMISRITESPKFERLRPNLLTGSAERARLNVKFEEGHWSVENLWDFMRLIDDNIAVTDNHGDTIVSGSKKIIEVTPAAPGAQAEA